MKPKVFIGTAAWNIPKAHRHYFGGQTPSDPIKAMANSVLSGNHSGNHRGQMGSDPTVLEKYSFFFNAVEINSSFYRDHQPKTYAKWAHMVPEDFRFSVKFPKRFTHTQKLVTTESEVREILSGMMELGEKLGALLIQFPPKLEMNLEVAQDTFSTIRKLYNGKIVLEPRHISWTTHEAYKLYQQFHISKVIADPEVCAANPKFCSAGDIHYFRLHGSPEIYKSSYSDEFLNQTVDEIKTSQVDTWCIFDNTTFGHATEDAINLQKKISK